MLHDLSRVAVEGYIETSELAPIGAQFDPDPPVDEEFRVPAPVVVSAHEHVNIWQLAQDRFVLVVKKVS